MFNQDMKEQFNDMIQAQAAVMEENAEELSESLYTMFTALQDAGFTEDQALEVMKSTTFGD